MLIVHTREGHRPDLSDCPPSKLARGRLDMGIGSPGPKGRILVRGEEGHDIIDALAHATGEVVIDKPGKGSFYATDLELLLRNGEIKSLIVTGVTTEVCVHTTVREANDRGFECLVLDGLRRLVLPRVSSGGLGDDLRAGRDLRLGSGFRGSARGSREQAAETTGNHRGRSLNHVAVRIDVASALAQGRGERLLRTVHQPARERDHDHDPGRRGGRTFPTAKVGGTILPALGIELLVGNCLLLLAGQATQPQGGA